VSWLSLSSLFHKRSSYDERKKQQKRARRGFGLTNARADGHQQRKLPATSFVALQNTHASRTSRWQKIETTRNYRTPSEERSQHLEEANIVRDPQANRTTSRPSSSGTPRLSPRPRAPTPSCRSQVNSWAPGCTPRRGVRCWPSQGVMCPSYEGPSRASRCSRTGLRTSTRF